MHGGTCDTAAMVKVVLATQSSLKLTFQDAVGPGAVVAPDHLHALHNSNVNNSMQGDPPHTSCHGIAKSVVFHE